MFTLPTEQPNGVEGLYDSIVDTVRHISDGETDLIANLANTASVLYHTMPDVNWAGFYILRDGELVLGPFHGKPACIRIALGRGVCGTAAEQWNTIVVENVDDFPGHIACDAASASEVVVPMIKDGKLIGVLDVDSPLQGRFTQTDAVGLERVVQILMSRL